MRITLAWAGDAHASNAAETAMPTRANFRIPLMGSIVNSSNDVYSRLDSRPLREHKHPLTIKRTRAAEPVWLARTDLAANLVDLRSTGWSTAYSLHIAFSSRTD